MPGFSILITSAPWSAKIWVAIGPAITADMSMIFTPSSAPGIRSNLKCAAALGTYAYTMGVTLGQGSEILSLPVNRWRPMLARDDILRLEERNFNA